MFSTAKSEEEILHPLLQKSNKTKKTTKNAIEKSNQKVDIVSHGNTTKKRDYRDTQFANTCFKKTSCLVHLVRMKLNIFFQ